MEHIDVAGLRIGFQLRGQGPVLALEFCRRYPSMLRSLVLVGAYTGWAGSLPPSEVRQRLEFALRAADMGPNAFDPTSMPGLFSDVMDAVHVRTPGTELPANECNVATVTPKPLELVKNLLDVL